MEGTSFNDVITVNGRPVEFNFIMSNGEWRMGYDVFSRELNLVFKLKNWMMNGLRFQFVEPEKLPEWIKSDMGILKSLNESILKSWRTTN